MYFTCDPALLKHEFSESKSPNLDFGLGNNSLIRSSPISNIPSTPQKELCQDHRPYWGHIRSLSDQMPRSVQTTARFQAPTPNLDSELKSELRITTLESENDISLCNQPSNRQKQNSRKSSVFHLAHPAPTLTQTQKFLQIRPRILLQLQLLSKKTRPKPFIDVLPSPVSIPRLARKFPRLFKGKGELGVNDVIVVKSEDYNSTMESLVQKSDSDEDGLANRELMAVICQVPGAKGNNQGVAEIILSDGSVLKATPLPGGLYEIKLKDENGSEMIAHWWIKTYPKRKSVESPDYADVNADLVYAFSLIEPNTRKHPVMATISHKKLEILNAYTSFSTSERHLSTSPVREIPRNSRVKNENSHERIMKEVDERLQRLIQVTGIWVTLRQNWCPYFRYKDALAVAVPNSNIHSKKGQRSSSLTLETRLPHFRIHAHDSTESVNGVKASSIGNTIRATIGRSRSTNRHSYYSEISAASEDPVSPGAAYVKRAAARRLSCTSSTHPWVEKNEEEKPITISRDSAKDCQKLGPSNQNSAISGSFWPESLQTPADDLARMDRQPPLPYNTPLTPHRKPDNIYAKNKDISITVHEFPYKSTRTGRRKVISNLFRRLNTTT